ncbi:MULTISPECIES: hypothetical protein [Paraburkholderia]|uniref:Uncharacterized protein n=1 Tax=Paraburkholderia madseniana TaxID=2599607 RepID=A0AAP5BKW1_9BURK|nr:MULTISPECIES: hypothetical protein [Paraburkholderia]MCX4150036.1 hypothetical protein [Paraburkholderia madseniana]MCX4175673.1 hypothetical protein [Paraburkholderia madseniana]MDN7152972.1 hypothetical protein [Paraburkholderia sp. WS6]MDQ6411854.1 hypothetical protein [Paraburkholderia madseniana]MDQ6463668.1 hypothetical protein [Paraburkholderia madseniana]
MNNLVTHSQPPGNPFVALGAALLAKLESEQPDFAQLHGPASPAGRPDRTFCHDLADRWAGAHPGDVVLRGWLLDAQGDPATHAPYRFVAHSVVLTARGEMVDVTLPDSERSRRFLAHPYDVCGFFGILVSPPLASVLEVFVAPPAISIGAGGTPSGDAP